MRRSGAVRVTVKQGLGAFASATIVTLFSACVSVTRTLPDGSTETLRGNAIREYAADVFQRHNAASSRLLEAVPFIEVESPELADRLLDAESRMNDACRPIDDLAVAYRDQGRVDLGDKLAFTRALTACEEQTEALEAQLQTIGI